MPEGMSTIAGSLVGHEFGRGVLVDLGEPRSRRTPALQGGLGMKTGVGMYVIAGVICAAPAVGAESVPLKPGEYQVTAVTESSNGEAGKPDTRSRCLKEEHLADPDAVFNYYALNGFKPNPANKVMNVSMHGGNVSYEIEGVYAITRVEGTVSNTSFSVVRKATPKGDKALSVTMKVDGKRTGDCASK